MRGGDEQSRGLAVLAMCGVSWVLIVAVSAGRAPAQAPLIGLHDFDAVLDVAVALFLVASAALLLVLILAGRGTEFEPPERRKRRGAWALFALALLLIYFRPNVVPSINEPADEASQPGPPEVDLEVPEPVPASETVAQASDIVLVLVAVAVLVGFVLVVRHWLARTNAVSHCLDHEAFEADLLVAIENAADLLDGVDPRSAVLNAYASLERVMADRGFDRTPSETPTEHLRRSTQSLRVAPDALVVLATLYERARFSDDVITASDQASAQAALAQARSNLVPRT